MDYQKKTYGQNSPRVGSYTTISVLYLEKTIQSIKDLYRGNPVELMAKCIIFSENIESKLLQNLPGQNILLVCEKI